MAVGNKTIQPTNVMQNASEILRRVGISAVTLVIRLLIFLITGVSGVLAWAMSIILVWFLYYIPSTLWYFALVQYQFNEERGCLLDNLTSRNYLFAIISCSIESVKLQITLLGLFIFPVIKRTLWGTKGTSYHSMLLQRVKKAIIITIVSLISDILFFFFFFFSFFVSSKVDEHINSLATQFLIFFIFALLGFC